MGRLLSKDTDVTVMAVPEQHCTSLQAVFHLVHTISIICWTKMYIYRSISPWAGYETHCENKPAPATGCMLIVILSHCIICVVDGA